MGKISFNQRTIKEQSTGLSGGMDLRNEKTGGTKDYFMMSNWVVG